MFTGNATTERALRCLTKVNMLVLECVDEARGSGDEQTQKRGWGADRPQAAQEASLLPRRARMEWVYRGGRDWDETLVLIGVSTLQLSSQEADASVVIGVSISTQRAFY